MLKGVDDARGELVLRIGGGGIAHRALFFLQLIVKEEGIGPVESAHAGHRRALLWIGAPIPLKRVICPALSAIEGR